MNNFEKHIVVVTITSCYLIITLIIANAAKTLIPEASDAPKVRTSMPKVNELLFSCFKVGLILGYNLQELPHIIMISEWLNPE